MSDKWDIKNAMDEIRQLKEDVEKLQAQLNSRQPEVHHHHHYHNTYYNYPRPWVNPYPIYPTTYPITTWNTTGANTISGTLTSGNSADA